MAEPEVRNRIVELGLVPYLHAIGDSVEEALWKIDAIAADFPDATMFVLDAFSNFEQAREVVPIAERRPNLTFDTALAYSFDHLVLPAIRRVGIDRFFYGSDIYSWPVAAKPAHVLSQIVASDLTDDDTALLLGGTLRRLLHLGAGS
jgi:hypothetical protein